ncbi:hypothetical protein K437DRAFT_296444 [Tilletiaria anomala UBC 951]|uniref:Uncharacterized protein n=1 Tax=Tilletiaria anomala (strain ATCC 24038 / CBS 436.72 / UBC 951) TaxID=1037660 RepID=A0A066VGW1_TILAU|nr:uncharacterized protein K437DRAFT_296444 [Tilletiaria anomala UBC 951]KDN37989.1 hypothetical protein K437DRAFT_296444 [Tilletiaria anomala UBC 951]
MASIAVAAGDDATPFLIRVYVKLGAPWRDLSSMQPGGRPLEDEFKLYVWSTTSLRTICAQLHAASPLSQPFSRHSFRVVYWDYKANEARARDYFHDITRVSRSTLTTLLGEENAREMLPKYLQRRDKGKMREADQYQEVNEAADDEAGKRNALKTVGDLRLREGAVLDCVIHAPAISSVAFRGPAPPQDAYPGPSSVGLVVRGRFAQSSAMGPMRMADARMSSGARELKRSLGPDQHPWGRGGDPNLGVQERERLHSRMHESRRETSRLPRNVGAYRMRDSACTKSRSRSPPRRLESPTRAQADTGAKQSGWSP